MLADSVAEIAALVGDTARARMLLALLDHVEMRASDLARRAGVSAQTTSFHLRKLSEAGLLTVSDRGRSRVYSLAGAEVAGALEALITIAPATRGPREARPLQSIERARMCYDHLAGQLGVTLTDALVSAGWLEIAGTQFAVTPEGRTEFQVFGIDVVTLHRLRRHFAKRCLDWTERRYHIAGALGAAIADALRRRKWIVAVKDTRAVHLTADGYRGLRKTFGVTL